MISLLQRVSEARVVVEGAVIGEIGAGLLVLVYSLVMGIEPMDESIWQAGTGGKHSVRNRLANMMNLNIGKIEDKANKLNHQLKLQSKSLDNLYKNAVAHEKFLNSLPSIKPVKAESLNRDVALLSGYGRRLHPVFRIWRKHTGIDFSCPRGTQIVATGQGVVSKINGNGRGYGKHVLIDHGYGYQTFIISTIRFFKTFTAELHLTKSQQVDYQIFGNILIRDYLNFNTTKS
jgi:hypothetical protein